MKGLRGQRLVRELRAGFVHRPVLSVVDARRGAGVLRVDAQTDVPLIVRLTFGDDLDRGFLLLGFLRDGAVAQVFPQTTVAGDGLEAVEPLGRQPRHASLLGIAVRDIGPTRVVLVLGPQQVLRLVADGVEVLVDVEVELEWVRCEGLLDLLLTIEGLGGITRQVQRLTRKLGRPARALNGEEHLVEQAEDGGREVVLVGLLLPLQVLALRVGLGNPAIGLLCGEELTGGFLDAAHGGLVAGEDAEVVLLAEAVEKVLDLLRRDLRVRADDEQHPAIPGKPPSPVITVFSALAFRKH